MENYFFETTIITSIFAVGNVFFGHFEEGLPKWRRVAKMVFVTAFAIAITALTGRTGFYVALGCMAGLFVFVHFWWLPKHGIHPLTAEPKERYYQFRGWKLPEQK